MKLRIKLTDAQKREKNKLYCYKYQDAHRDQYLAYQIEYARRYRQTLTYKIALVSKRLSQHLASGKTYLIKKNQELLADLIKQREQEICQQNSSLL